MKKCDLLTLDRLESGNQIDTIVTCYGIGKTIKSFKNNTPGETKISKKICYITQEKVLIKLQLVFSHMLPMGHFPKIFKAAINKLLQKPKKVIGLKVGKTDTEGR